MRATSAEAGEFMERVEAELSDLEKAHVEYLAWMAAWRARNGHHGPFDPVTGFPLKSEAAE